MATKNKTFKVTVHTPSPEESAKLRQIIEEVKEEKKRPFNPDEWEVCGPGEALKKPLSKKL